MTLPRPQTDAERAHVIRFTHPERWPLLGRYPVARELLDELLAQMLGCSAREVQAAAVALQGSVMSQARELLAEPGYRAAVERLPFADGDTVVAVGDSLTAERLSWFELLAASLESAGRPVRMRNLALSGDTSADVLERWDLIAAARPTHMVVMLGTNDARSHGRRHRQRMVSAGETRRNLAALQALATGELGCRVTMITPPPADRARAGAHFAGLPLGWDTDAVDEVADVVRDLDPAAIDLHAALRSAADLTALLEDDGVHLSPQGQRVAARFIATELEHALERAARP